MIAPVTGSGSAPAWTARVPELSWLNRAVLRRIRRQHDERRVRRLSARDERLGRVACATVVEPAEALENGLRALSSETPQSCPRLGDGQPFESVPRGVEGAHARECARQS